MRMPLRARSVLRSTSRRTRSRMLGELDSVVVTAESRVFGLGLSSSSWSVRRRTSRSSAPICLRSRWISVPAGRFTRCHTRAATSFTPLPRARLTPKSAAGGRDLPAMDQRLRRGRQHPLHCVVGLSPLRFLCHRFKSLMSCFLRRQRRSTQRGPVSSVKDLQAQRYVCHCRARCSDLAQGNDRPRGAARYSACTSSAPSMTVSITIFDS